MGLASSRIAWLVPSPIKGSGGHRTFYAHIQNLARLGAAQDVYVHLSEVPEESHSAEGVRARVEAYFGPVAAEFHAGWDVAKSVDLAIATVWWSATYLADLPLACPKAYFIQDYEAYFDAVGDGYLLAESSYRLGLIPVTIGRWLSHRMQSEFGTPSRYFDFSADSSIYHDLGQPRARAVCFIYQPEKPRRCPAIGREALSRLSHQMPDAKIYTYGNDQEPDFWFPAEHLGLISRERCNDLYNRCAVGLCISATNPSRIPFEMMAAGLPVVDVHRENTVYDFPEGPTLLAAPDPESISAALIRILEDPRLQRQMRADALEFMRERPARIEFDQFAEVIDDILNGVLQGSPGLRRMYHRQPVGRSVSGPHAEAKPAPGPDRLTPGGTNEPAAFSGRPDAALVVSLDRVGEDGGAVRHAELLSIDVWDTALRRRCHPDEVKLFSALALLLSLGPDARAGSGSAWDVFERRREIEAELGRESQAAGYDDEYELTEVLARLVAECTSPSATPATQADRIGALADLEIEHEIEVTYADPTLPGLIENIAPSRLVATSDFYMTETALRRIMARAASELLPERIFVSCDARVNKRSGRLFSVVASESGVPPARVVHIGDNPESDVRAATAAGFRAIGFHSELEDGRRRQRETAFLSRRATQRPRTDDLDAEMARLRRPEGQDAGELFDVGVNLAPALAGLAAFILMEARRSGQDSVFFFTREGRLFREVFEAFVAERPYGPWEPSGHTLAVSRIATYLPSIRELSTQECMRSWNLYSNQSLSAFLRTFGLDPSPYRTIAARHGIDLASVIEYPWQDERIQVLFSDHDFASRILAERDARRERLLAYLSQEGLVGRSRALVVDIGWRGTIQDSIALLLPDTRIDGAYLGLHRMLNEQPVNAFKRAFIADENRAGSRASDPLIRYVRPFEMLFNSPGGSVEGYEESGGRYRPVLRSSPVEDGVFERHITHVQAGILAGVPVAARWVGLHAITPEELASIAAERFKSILWHPPRALMNAYFELDHNEMFGVGRFASMGTVRFPYRDAGLAVLGRRHRARFKARLADSGWPQAVLANTLGGVGHRILARTGKLGSL